MPLSKLFVFKGNIMNLNKAGRVQRLVMVSFLPLDSYIALAKLYHPFRASSPHLKISGLNWLGSRVSSSSKICKPHPVKSPWPICVSEMLFAGWLRPGLLLMWARGMVYQKWRKKKSISPNGL